MATLITGSEDLYPKIEAGCAKSQLIGADANLGTNYQYECYPGNISQVCLDTFTYQSREYTNDDVFQENPVLVSTHYVTLAQDNAACSKGAAHYVVCDTSIGKTE